MSFTRPKFTFSSHFVFVLNHTSYTFQEHVRDSKLLIIDPPQLDLDEDAAIIAEELKDQSITDDISLAVVETGDMEAASADRCTSSIGDIGGTSSLVSETSDGLIVHTIGHKVLEVLNQKSYTLATVAKLSNCSLSNEDASHTVQSHCPSEIVMDSGKGRSEDSGKGWSEVPTTEMEESGEMEELGERRESIDTLSATLSSTPSPEYSVSNAAEIIDNVHGKILFKGKSIAVHYEAAVFKSTAEGLTRSPSKEDVGE
jgi:hypothetical protein